MQVIQIIPLKLDALNVIMSAWHVWIVKWEQLHGYGVFYLRHLHVQESAVFVLSHVEIKFIFVQDVEES